MPRILLSCALFFPAVAVGSAEPVSFRKEIAPLLLQNCLACHGPKKAEGGYRVDSFERIMRAGDSGEAGIAANHVAGSEVFRRITSDDPDERMPLEAEPLSQGQLALVRRWIAEGAKYDADDPTLPLARIVPPSEHPSAPAQYVSTIAITALAFRPDGNQLFVGGYYELTVWNVPDGKLVRRIGNVGQRIYGLAFRPDGKMLAVASGTPGILGELRLLNPTEGTLARVLASTSDVMFDVAFNPSGDRLAVVAADGVLRVFEVATGKQELEITSHSDWVLAVAWSVTGDRLATASRDKTAKVFDAKTGELIVTYNGHGKAVNGVSFHPQGDQVYSSGSDGRIHQWKMADGKEVAKVGSFGGEVYKLSSGNDFFIGVSADKTARQYDRKTRKEIRRYSGHRTSVLSSSYHDGLQRLATGSFDGEVRVWNAVDGNVIVKFVAAPGIEKPNEEP